MMIRYNSIVDGLVFDVQRRTRDNVGSFPLAYGMLPSTGVSTNLVLVNII
jgi:hypothetical protein